MAGLLRSLVAVAAVATVALLVVAFGFYQTGPSVAQPALQTAAPDLRAAPAERPAACDIRTHVDGIGTGRLAGAGSQTRSCVALTGPTPVIPEIELPVLLPLSTGLVALAVVLLRRAGKHSARRRQG